VRLQRFLAVTWKGIEKIMHLLTDTMETEILTEYAEGQ